MSSMVRRTSSIREWFDGLKSPGAALAPTARTSKLRVAGTVVRGDVEAGITGAVLGAVSAHMGGNLDAGAKGEIPVDGLVAFGAAVGAVAMSGHEMGTTLASVSKAAVAVMGYRKGEAIAAAKMGKTPAVAASKTAQLAAAATAHGEGSDANTPGNWLLSDSVGAEDPLLSYAAANFKTHG